MENNKKNNDSIRDLQIKVVVGMINITNQVKKESTTANLDEPDLILIPTDENNTKTSKKNDIISVFAKLNINTEANNDEIYGIL